MHFLSAADFSSEIWERVVHRALDMKAHPDDYSTALGGRSIGLFFAKPSLRTRLSSFVGVAEMAGHALVVSQEQIGVGTREAPGDVSRVMERYLAAVAMRVFEHATLTEFAETTAMPVINLLSDAEHPCQAVADVVTIAEHRPLEGTVLAYVGDGNNVAHSLILAAQRTGMNIRISSPEGYEPAPEFVDAGGGAVELVRDPAAAVAGAHVVYTDVWTSMGDEAHAGDRRSDFVDYRVTSELMARADTQAIFLHCLPAHDDEEVARDVIESSASRVFDQAENRLHAFKSILLECLDDGGTR
ncbi:MAG: ornithine carbamoyltransferase [Acidimicrobiia bacterium]|nr:ornithine carbamoyltransferase [Acidimicrobiia bacterium]NNL28033.1 ornithine carbamoyltransferase [Acidimicrobiia bacterium]